MIDTHYEESPRKAYESPYGGSLVFLRVCPDCGRFVAADKAVKFRESFDGIYSFEPNATCKTHGRVQMPFEGDI